MDSYRVVNSFIDKISGKGFNTGSTFTSEDSERVSYLIQEGYLKGPPPKRQIDEALIAEGKRLKIKGYTKMDKVELTAAIEAAEKAKKASE